MTLQELIDTYFVMCSSNNESHYIPNDSSSIKIEHDCPYSIIVTDTDVIIEFSEWDLPYAISELSSNVDELEGMNITYQSKVEY
jgi:hypothetical protein